MIRKKNNSLMSFNFKKFALIVGLILALAGVGLFIYLGYFLVRASTENPERGKRFAAVVGIVGALDIPLIHLSVRWFRSLHPGPVVIKPEGPTLAPEMLTTIMVGLLSLRVAVYGDSI